jgi:hypothetical protein
VRVVCQHVDKDRRGDRVGGVGSHARQAVLVVIAKVIDLSRTCGLAPKLTGKRFLTRASSCFT